MCNLHWCYTWSWTAMLSANQNRVLFSCITMYSKVKVKSRPLDEWGFAQPQNISKNSFSILWCIVYLQQKRKKLKVKLKQEPLSTRKNISVPSCLPGKKMYRGSFLFWKLPSLSPQAKQLHQGAKCFVKAAKQHLKQTKRLSRTMCLCNAALPFMSN